LHTNEASLPFPAAVIELPPTRESGAAWPVRDAKPPWNPWSIQLFHFSANLRGAAALECHFTSRLRTRSGAIVSLPAAVGSLQMVDLKSLDKLEIR
jgi:hypothetical protein